MATRSPETDGRSQKSVDDKSEGRIQTSAGDSQLERDDLMTPRARVTLDELARMPATLTPAEGLPWTRLGRSAYYRWLAESGLGCRLGHSIRIPTRRFLLALGVLDEEA